MSCCVVILSVCVLTVLLFSIYDHLDEGLLSIIYKFQDVSEIYILIFMSSNVDVCVKFWWNVSRIFFCSSVSVRPSQVVSLLNMCSNVL